MRPSRLNPDGSYTLRVTSKNGGLKDTTGATHDYNVAMTGAIEKTVTAKALNTSPETADVANNTASAAAPKAINFTFTVTGVTVTSEDVITIELIDNATVRLLLTRQQTSLSEKQSIFILPQTTSLRLQFLRK